MIKFQFVGVTNEVFYRTVYRSIDRLMASQKPCLFDGVFLVKEKCLMSWNDGNDIVSDKISVLCWLQWSPCRVVVDVYCNNYPSNC